MVDFLDMKFFVRAVTCGSLSAAGRELGFSPAVASKRLSRMEAQLGARLLQRSSRRLVLTTEGELYVERCRQILADVEDAEALINDGKREAKGILHVSCPVALGRRLIGAAIAGFMREWPQLKVRLSLSDSVVDVLADGFDCAIRIGGSEDSQLVARKLADNWRIICASPEYISQYGQPTTPADLASHRAIILSAQFKEVAEWKLNNTLNQESVNAKVPVRMTTDNGEQAHDWALAGIGIISRSIWDVKKELENDELIQLLPEWRSEPAPIRIVFPSRQFLPARTRLFIDFLVDFFINEQNMNHQLNTR